MSNIKIKTDKLLIFTGGHHTSALVVAESATGQGWQPIWIGHKHASKNDTGLSAEYLDVTSAGIPFYELKSGKVFGSGNPLAIFRVFFSLIKSISVLRQIRQKYQPNRIGIVSFGGYISVPVVLAGWLMGIPGLTHEQTAVGGGANRFLAHFVKKVALTWPESSKYFPKTKTVVTGLPLRAEILKIKRNPSQNNLPQIFITGGKQGSHTLNDFIFNHLSQLLEKYQIIHQTGSNTAFKDNEQALAKKSQLPLPLSNRYQTAGYFSGDQTATILSGVNVVIGRSGAHTIYELGYLGIPSVLIPIPWSSGDEQMANAQILASAGLAIILPQSKLSLPNLLQSIQQSLQLKAAPMTLLSSGTRAMTDLIDQTF